MKLSSLKNSLRSFFKIDYDGEDLVTALYVIVLICIALWVLVAICFIATEYPVAVIGVVVFLMLLHGIAKFIHKKWG